jgi:hypothetical protein
MKQTLQWFIDRVGREVKCDIGEGHVFTVIVDSEGKAELYYEQQNTGYTFTDI